MAPTPKDESNVIAWELKGGGWVLLTGMYSNVPKRSYI